MKYHFVRQYKRKYPVSVMCRVLTISRSSYYSWQRRPMSNHQLANELILAKIKQVRQSQPKKEVYGSPRMKDELNADGYSCSENRVARIMHQAGVFSKIKRKYKATTDSEHKYPVAKNLINQNFTATQPNKVWLTDITYLWTKEGWVYLAAVLDVFSRVIVGWAVSDRLKKELVVHSLRNAMIQRNPDQGLIIHSDRGSQYASEKVRTMINNAGYVQSMSGRGNCYDNAMMESFFHSLKSEHIHFQKYKTREEVKSDLFEHIELFYNRERRHSSIGNLSPFEYEKRFRSAA